MGKSAEKSKGRWCLLLYSEAKQERGEETEKDVAVLSQVFHPNSFLKYTS